MPVFRSATADLFILICCTSILLRVTAAVATDFKLQPRKNVDHNLNCHGRPVPPARNWPASGPPRSLYQSLEQLCGRVAGRPTVGCLCDAPYTRVECPNTGTISLETNQVLWQKYREYCQQCCECANRGPIRWSSVSDEASIREVAAGLDVAREGLSHLGLFRLRTPQARTEPSSHSIPRSLDATQEGMCGGSCSAITEQCSSGSTGQCKCTAQPVGGTSGSMVQFSGSCATFHTVPISIGRIGDNQVPDGSNTVPMVMDDTTGFFAGSGDRIACPCNATYVSYGCCGSRNGIVWETPDKKLGELKGSV